MLAYMKTFPPWKNDPGDEAKVKAMPRKVVNFYRGMAKKLGIPESMFDHFCVVAEEEVELELERRKRRLPSIQSMGGIARKKKLSAKRRKEIATKASLAGIRARWGTKRK